MKETSFLTIAWNLQRNSHAPGVVASESGNATATITTTSAKTTNGASVNSAARD